MSKQQQIVELALSQVGYKEKSSNDMLDDFTVNAGAGNYTKYARDLDAITGIYNGKKQGYAWCDVFVDWCFVKCFGAEAAMAMLCQPTQSAGAGCTYSLGYYRAKNRFFNYPEVGDQIFFGGVSASTHTGIVVGFDANTVTTVEGNCADGVNKRTYQRNSNYIAGYGRPIWDAETVVKPSEINVNQPTINVPAKDDTFSLTMHEMAYGSKGLNVMKLQWLLQFGYDAIEVDGEFGPETKKAVMRFQSSNGLECDGIVGKKTMRKLLGV